MFLDASIQEDARKNFPCIYILLGTKIRIRGMDFVHLLLFDILVSHLYEMSVYGDHGKTMRLSPRKSTKSIGMNVEQVRK